MSELAYRYQDSVVFMETEGNITRLFFEHETAEPEGLVQDSTLAFPTAAVDGHMTPRQRELALTERRDMTVQPLESYEQVRAMIAFFEDQGRYREACLLTFGFCTGLRISDLLNLKVSDVISSVDPLVFKPEIDIHEQKTGKRTVTHLDSVLITEAMQESFARYFASKTDTGMDRCLFTTQRSGGKKPMSIRMIQLALAPAFAAVCPHLHCSTHTMRKTFVSIIHTFAAQATMTGAGINPATACQIALRHASSATTLAYMGTIKTGMLSLRRAVSDFVMGRTVIRSLKSEYVWETIDE